MNILFLLTQDIESPSGLGRYYPLAKVLVQMDHEVTIAALHPNFREIKQNVFKKEGINIIYCGQMHVRKQGSQKTYFSTPKLLGYSTTATLGLVKVILKSPADIVHVGKPHPMNSIAGLLGKYTRGKLLLLDCDDYESGSNRLSKNWQGSVINFFEQKIPHQAISVTTNTHFMKNKLMSWGIPENNIFYLSNGVDRQRFSSPNPEILVSLREKLGLGNKKVVAYIGSLSLTSHPVDILIDAFARIYALHPGTILMIVGGGEDYVTLTRQVSSLDLNNAVRFIGRISPEEVPLYYSLAHVSIDPVYDNDAARGRSPLKLFESWAAGVPFISADVGDRSYLLGSPPAGILAMPGDPESLAEKIIQVLNDSELSTELIKLGAQRLERYDWDVLAAQLESHYKQLLMT